VEAREKLVSGRPADANRSLLDGYCSDELEAQEDER
jgi:hypothetical protein